MQPILLTPREFLVLNMLVTGRYYRLGDIRAQYTYFLALYADSLGYLHGPEPFARVICELLQKGLLKKGLLKKGLLKKGLLKKAKRPGCNLLLCLSTDSIMIQPVTAND